MRSPLPVEADRLVVNTGPLIALGRVDAFDIIGRLPVIFIVPKEVADEIEAGARAGYPRGDTGMGYGPATQGRNRASRIPPARRG